MSKPSINTNQIPAARPRRRVPPSPINSNAPQSQAFESSQSISPSGARQRGDKIGLQPPPIPQSRHRKVMNQMPVLQEDSSKQVSLRSVTTPSRHRQSVMQEIESKQARSEPYKPVADKYVRQLMRIIHTEIDEELSEPTVSDFLTEDSYYSWLDRQESNASICIPFPAIVQEYLRRWDLQHPLLSQAPYQAQHQVAGAQTTVTLVFRVIQARNLIADSKGRDRNCFALIEYQADSGTDALRYETEPQASGLSPVWNQQITLGVKDIMAPITVSVYHLKEKNNLITGSEVKEEFLGSVHVNVGEVVKECAKMGFYSQWKELTSDRAPKDKWIGKDVSGELLLEAEMGGFVDEVSAIASELPKELMELLSWQHTLITNKVNLKSLYEIILRAVILRDLCVPPGKNLFNYPIKSIAFKLSATATTILNEFSRVWLIPAMFQQMKYLELVFEMYEQQRLHARALTGAYQVMYENVFKSGRVWLPNHEKPLLLALMKKIENYTTSQIVKFKLYFPVHRDDKNQLDIDSNLQDHISSSIDCILLVTRMIDKNEMFLEDLESSLAETDQLGAAKDIEPVETNDPFARRKHRSDNSSTSAILKPAISEYDFKNGKFRFSEKLLGLIRTAAASRYTQLESLAVPPLTGSDDLVETSLVKARDLARLLLEEVEEDELVYSKAFKNDNNFDLVAVNVETYAKFFILEMENLAATVHQHMRKSKSLSKVRVNSQITDASTVVQSQNEDDLVQVGFELMRFVIQMSKQWAHYMSKDKALEKSASGWYHYFLEKYVTLSEVNTCQWAQNACEQDSFQVSEHSGQYQRSSSAQDTFTALIQSVSTVKEAYQMVRENDRLNYALQMTRLGQLSEKVINSYCNSLEARILSIPQTPSANLTSVVWDFINQGKPAAGQSMESLTEVASRSKACCIALANLEFWSGHLPVIYEALDGEVVFRIVASWKKAKKLSNTTKSEPNMVTGLVGLSILAAYDLKRRSAMYGTKNNPFVEARANGKVIALTKPIVNQLNVRYTTANPNKEHDVTNKNQLFINGADYVFAAEQLSQLKFTVRHQQDSSFLSGTSEVEMGSATWNIPADTSLTKERLHHLELQPQGHIVFSMFVKTEGLVGEISKFGTAGVEGLESYFSRMKTIISNSRYRITLMLCEEISLILWPKTLRLLQSEPLDEMALKEVFDVLNDTLGLVSRYSSERRAQQTIYTVWQQCVQFPLMHYVDVTLKSQTTMVVTETAKQLLQFFHADGEGLGLPLEQLKESSSYDLKEAAKGVQLSRKIFG